KSNPLTEALEAMKDQFIQSFPGLYGSDDRVQACMSELGVPLTKELVFHQAYVDSSVIMGQTSTFQNDVKKYGKIEYMKGLPENNFFPNLSSVCQADIIFFCLPNNPTGSTATRKQMEQLVSFAKDNGSIIVYDCA
ncbi:hypothetical protein KI387_022784, partial [Taxus chinensis]